MKTTKVFWILLFLILIYMTNVKAALETTQNLTNTTIAENCITASRQIMQELIKNGFNVQRVNDTIKKAEQLLELQKSLELKKQKTDYSIIFSYCSEIERIEKEAYEAKDAFYSLEIQYNNFIEIMKSYDINVSEVEALMNDVRQEIEDERYEKVKEKVPEVEKKIMGIQAEASTMKLFYKTVSGGFKNFVVEHYILLITTFITAVVLWLAYRIKIKKFLISRKINKLEIEKNVLRDLIKETQKDYFQYGKIPEGIYNIKTKRYAEMIRDIDRQIPLLKEELARANVKLRKKK